MIRVGVAIQHASFDPERRALFTDVIRTLGEEAKMLPPSNTMMVKTPTKQPLAIGFEVYPYVVVRDSSRQGVWKTNREAWIAALQSDGLGRAPTHVLVLQDDMEIVPAFWRGVAQAIYDCPTAPICLLCARQDMETAANAGASWVELPDGTWGGSTILPTVMAEEFLTWERANVRPECPSADARVDLFLREHDRYAYATVPSLIEHVGNRSLIGHAPGRRARVLARFGSDFKGGPTTGANVIHSRKALNYRMFEYLRGRTT